MTEKRFMIDDAGELIDVKNAQFIEYGDEVCKLLNDLSEKNKQLKQENKEIQDSLWTTTYIRKLEKENEQLKSEINMLKTTIARNEAYIKSMEHKGVWKQNFL